MYLEWYVILENSIPNLFGDNEIKTKNNEKTYN